MKIYIYIFVLAMVLGVLWKVSGEIYRAGEQNASGECSNAQNEALKLKLAEAQQYQEFLIDNQRKNEEFIKKQRKALNDARENDGDVAPILRGTLERLCRERADCALQK